MNSLYFPSVVVRFAALISAVCGLWLPGTASAQTTVQNTTYSSGQNVTVNDTTITANTNVTAASGAIVKYRAITSVTLGPGFTASSGSAFRAFIFVDTDGDGMDDAWEVLHGLNPNNAADAAGDIDSDGLSNLAEYLLGTNPASAKQTDSSDTTKLKIQTPN